MMELTTEWNLIKYKMDQSSGENRSTADPIAFADALSELESIKPKVLFELCSKVKANRYRMKFDTPLRSDLLSQYEFMRRVYKNAPTFLKRMNMSDKQRAAAQRQSLNMKMRWGSY